MLIYRIFHLGNIHIADSSDLSGAKQIAVGTGKLRRFFDDDGLSAAYEY